VKKSTLLDEKGAMPKKVLPSGRVLYISRGQPERGAGGFSANNFPGKIPKG